MWPVEYTEHLRVGPTGPGEPGEPRAPRPSRRITLDVRRQLERELR